MSNNTATVWLSALVLIAVFLFAGEQDFQDAMIGYVVDANGGR